MFEKLFRGIANTFSRKESQTAGIITAPGGSRVIWPQRGYDNFARETYLKNVTAFRAIDEVAKSAASVPWKQYRGTDVVEKEGISKQLTRPNPNESWQWFMLKTVAYLVMSGNSFIERVGPTSGPNKGIIKELYSLRPDRFRMLHDRGRLSAYQYEVEGRKTTWEIDPITGHADVLQLKAFHPLDDWWGAAPTESAAREIDTSNAATEWNKSLLDNQGRPGMVYTLIGALGAEQMDELERYLSNNHGGPANVGKDLILTGERGTNAQPYGWSPTDMDFGEGDIRLMRKIAMAYGVPPELLGIESATFNNRGEARLFFWENTVIWWLNYIRGELNNWLFEEGDDLSINYVLDEVPAFSIKRNLIWERAQNSDFLSINEKREMVGKDDWGEEGNVILVEASKIPLGMTKEETGKTEEQKAREDLIEQGYDDDEIDDILGSESDYEDSPVNGGFKADEMTRQDWLDAWKQDPHWATSIRPSPLAKELVSMEAENKVKGRILEIGCGNGRDSIYFGKQGHSVVGIDISPVAIKIAESNNSLSNVQFEVGDAEKLRFDSSSFDAVYSLSVLHTTDMKKSIPEISRVLKTKGIVLLYLYIKTIFIDDEDNRRTVVNFKVAEMDASLKDNNFQILDKYQSKTEDEDEEGKHIHNIIVYFLRKK